jgi:hypothetical protein
MSGGMNFSEIYSKFGARAVTQGRQNYGKKRALFGLAVAVEPHGYTALSMYRVNVPNFMKIRPVEPAGGRADGRADGRT